MMEDEERTIRDFYINPTDGRSHMDENKPYQTKLNQSID